MSNITTNETKMLAVESALVRNDISKLTPQEKQSYYNALCASVGLNPLTKPFAFLTLQGREVLYATKDCSEQLRKIHGVSTQIVTQAIVGDSFEVHVKARDKTGREDEDIAIIPIGNLKGNDLANLKMKCVTKAKRRVTLSICGLGVLDESELDTISREAITPASNPQITSPFAKADPIESPKAVEAQETEPTDVGEYVVLFGQKLKGKKIKDILPHEHESMLRWLDGEQRKGKTLSPQALEYAINAEAFLAPDRAPAFDPSEEMPG